MPLTTQMDSPKNNRRNVKHKRKVREALSINRLNTLSETDKTFKVLNRGNGDMSKRTAGNYFRKIGNH